MMDYEFLPISIGGSSSFIFEKVGHETEVIVHMMEICASCNKYLAEKNLDWYNGKPYCEDCWRMLNTCYILKS